MGRPLRLLVPGLPHHLLLRGHNRQPVFADDLDRRQFLAELQAVCREYRLPLHGYALLDNHVHLLLTPGDATAISRAMQSLGRRYVAAYNQRHARSGSLWEGRFRTCVIDPDAAFMACLRHIETHAQRDAMAPDLLISPWSSLPHHLGARSDPLITDHPAFWRLGNTPFDREWAYRRSVEEAQDPAQTRALSARLLQGGVLGDAAFIERLSQQTQRTLTPARRGRPPRGPRSTGAIESGTN